MVNLLNRYGADAEQLGYTDHFIHANALSVLINREHKPIRRSQLQRIILNPTAAPFPLHGQRVKAEIIFDLTGFFRNLIRLQPLIKRTVSIILQLVMMTEHVELIVLIDHNGVT